MSNAMLSFFFYKHFYHACKRLLYKNNSTPTCALHDLFLENVTQRKWFILNFRLVELLTGLMLT